MFRPKYLQNKTPPDAARRAVCCGVCGAPLVLTESGWLGCERALHGKLVNVAVAAAVCEAHWPLLAKRRLTKPLNIIRRVLAAQEVKDGAEQG